MQTLAVLGSTGSIGTSTLDVVRRSPGTYRVWALAAGRNCQKLAEQIQEFRPRVAVVASEREVALLTDVLASTGLPREHWPEILFGPEALVSAATADEVSFVLSAIVGVAGLEATYEAARRGKRIGLANKETLVAGGELVMRAVKESGAELIPVDSEHNGVHQCLRAGRRSEVTRLVLTASGGPFRLTPPHLLARVTPTEALNHPTWRMGPRITVDSATLMNKGFEVIEACWLFDFAPSDVSVVIHPQSSVHAMVEFKDGSVLAQASATDMRMPIQYALTFPNRAEAPVPKVDWTVPRMWEFTPPDFERFPLLKTAYEAQETGGSAGCVMNAADEVAVAAFLDGQLPYLGVADVVQETLARVASRKLSTVGDVLAADEEARAAALQCARERALAGV